MDFAIIETGGKQYKITPDTNLEIEKIAGEAGDKVSFDKVLMIVDGDKVEIGNPYLEGQKIDAQIAEQKKGVKIKILRFKAKSRYRRRQGHRQQLTAVSFGQPKTSKTVAKKSISKKQ